MNGVVLGFSEVAATIINYFMVDTFSRNKTIITTESITLFVAVLLVLFTSCNDLNNCPDYLKTIQTVGLCILKFALSCSYNFFYLMQIEIFPNQVRGMALQVTAIAAYMAYILLPITISLCKQYNVSIILLFAVLSVLIILATMRMK